MKSIEEHQKMLSEKELELKSINTGKRCGADTEKLFLTGIIVGENDFSESQISAGDMDGNGSLNILDVVVLVDIILEN